MASRLSEDVPEPEVNVKWKEVRKFLLASSHDDKQIEVIRWVKAKHDLGLG